MSHGFILWVVMQQSSCECCVTAALIGRCVAGFFNVALLSVSAAKEPVFPGGVLGYISDGDVRRPFLGLKFSGGLFLPLRFWRGLFWGLMKIVPYHS